MVILYTLLISSFTLFNTAKAKGSVPIVSASSRMAQQGTIAFSDSFNSLTEDQFKKTYHNWNKDHSYFLVKNMNENLAQYSTIGYRFAVDENGAIWILPNGTQKGKHLVEMGVEGHHNQYAEAYAAFFANLLDSHTDIYHAHKDQTIDTSHKSHIEHLFNFAQDVKSRIEAKRSRLPAATAMQSVAERTTNNNAQHHTTSVKAQSVSPTNTQAQVPTSVTQQVAALAQAIPGAPDVSSNSNNGSAPIAQSSTVTNPTPITPKAVALSQAILEEYGIHNGLDAEARKILAQQSLTEGIRNFTISRIALDEQGISSKNGLIVNKAGQILDSEGISNKGLTDKTIDRVALNSEGVSHNGLKPLSANKLTLDLKPQSI